MLPTQKKLTMKWQMKVSLCILSCVFAMASLAAGAVTSQASFVTAYMDRQGHPDQAYGCGDTILDTVSGEVSAAVPAYASDFNCSLTFVSPPGTLLSLTVTHLHLVVLDLNTCQGNRLKIRADAGEASPSLLPSFPHGLCGYTRPNQAVMSSANRVHLLLESRQTVLGNTFNLSYTAFQTDLDDECFACDVGASLNQFCIDPRLVCDDRQNCPEKTEETTANCMDSSGPETQSGNIVVIVVVCVMAVVLIAVIIFVILVVMTKRAHSKRNRGSGGPDRAERASQSRGAGGGETPPPGLTVDLDRRQRYADVPEQYELTQYPPPPRLLDRPPGAPPTYSVSGEYRGGARPVTGGGLPGAPPAYSTLPRPMELSLQMADNTNPTSRSRTASTDDEVEPRTP